MTFVTLPIYDKESPTGAHEEIVATFRSHGIAQMFVDAWNEKYSRDAKFLPRIYDEEDLIK